jgi:hypothetical protein
MIRNNGQTEAGASSAAIARLLDPVEGLGDPVELVRRNTGSLVGHFDDDLVCLVPDRHPGNAPVPEGVVYQAEDRTAHENGLNPGHDALRRLHCGIPPKLAELLDHSVDEGGDVHRPPVRRTSQLPWPAPLSFCRMTPI